MLNKSFIYLFYLLIFAIQLFSPFTVFADSYGSPSEETYYSANKEYYLHKLPVGEWLDDNFFVQWTFGKASGEVYFQVKKLGSEIIGISNDGERICAIGYYDKITNRNNGILLIDKDGEVLRHIRTPSSLPNSRSISRIWWFWKGTIIDSLSIFVVQLYDGSRRIYSLKTGNLIFIFPAVWQLAVIFSFCVVLYGLFTTRLSMSNFKSKISANKLLSRLIKSFSISLLNLSIVSVVVFLINYFSVYDKVYYFSLLQLLDYDLNQSFINFFLIFNAISGFILSLYLIFSKFNYLHSLSILCTSTIFTYSCIFLDSNAVEPLLVVPIVVFSIVLFIKKINGKKLASGRV